MQLNHITLNIDSTEERVGFYQSILGFKPEYEFDMPANLSVDILGIEKDPKVVLFQSI